MSHLRTGSINVFISGKLLFSSMLGAGHVSLCAAVTVLKVWKLRWRLGIVQLYCHTALDSVIYRM